MSNLLLDEEHRYWLGNEELWGVTSVLQDNGFVDDSWYTETHSSRGQAVHAVLAGVARGLTFDWDLLDVDLHGWVRSGLAYLEELKKSGAEIIAIEKMLHHPLYMFAGTMDLVYRRNGLIHIDDYKTGMALPCTRFQLAGYEILINQLPEVRSVGKAIKKASIELNKDGGRARLVEYNGLEYFHDGNRFLSYLTTSRDRAKFGPKPRKTIEAVPMVQA